MLSKKLLAALLITAMPSLAAAQDYQPKSPFSGWTVFSAGVLLHADKVLGSEARITHYFDAEYFHFHPLVDFSVTDQGGVWFGAGVYIEGEMPVNTGNLFVGASFAPGVYIRNNEFDLGYPLEFRSGIEVGYKTESGYRFSISYDHRSNARIRKINPGMETIQFRIGKHFN
ncbi:acyloxyacyl hydrolase [Rhizobium sp. L1K21]|uniref:acyloxyacyl hydrolase n=1 Tax=Rhizobium sp. L1K21 TaxID=2954933 RepID=UPI002092BB40|nr:acyloxyacyl hydrolase [Rhizobium sp. L1K21]MCO6186028.1 acyloxyacyl hydrolase [Rhizobium sp. L1K21]